MQNFEPAMEQKDTDKKLFFSIKQHKPQNFSVIIHSGTKTRYEQRSLQNNAEINLIQWHHNCLIKTFPSITNVLTCSLRLFLASESNVVS